MSEMSSRLHGPVWAGGGGGGGGWLDCIVFGPPPQNPAESKETQT